MLVNNKGNTRNLNVLLWFGFFRNYLFKTVFDTLHIDFQKFANSDIHYSNSCKQEHSIKISPIMVIHTPHMKTYYFLLLKL